ncbi:MAG: thiamine pyrophosphate-dependent enzyme [Patescibacteria group bacterium]|jgi:2-oxoglutarate ferredoxin oxidoreductase subunit beta
MPKKTEQFETGLNPSWCPGCGDWAIYRALKTVFTELGLKNENIAIAYGIGCSGNMASYLDIYGFHGLHGRPLPVAAGIKMANDRLTVLAAGGDGDGYGEGISHFLHQMRANQDITYLVFDNQVYGLTQGQVSPRGMKGYKASTTPDGVIEEPVNPIALALANNATFVARTFAIDFLHNIKTIKKAIQHKGFSLVNIIQPCQTFNKLNTHSYWQRRIYNMEEEKNYRSNDRMYAMEKAFEGPEPRFPVGIFYQEKRLSYEDELPQIKKNPLVQQSPEGRSVRKLFSSHQ